MYSSYKRQRILHFDRLGYKPPKISRLLQEDGLIASRVGIYKFLRKFNETGGIARRPGSGRPTKITDEVKFLVERQMREDDETTAVQLHMLLVQNGYHLTLRTVLRCRVSLGWTFRGSAYCQLIRQANKNKHVEWAQKHHNNNFANVIWTDECSVQVESYRRYCCHKRGEQPKPKPR